MEVEENIKENAQNITNNETISLDVTPKETLYVSNLNQKLSKEGIHISHLIINQFNVQLEKKYINRVKKVIIHIILKIWSDIGYCCL